VHLRVVTPFAVIPVRKLIVWHSPAAPFEVEQESLS